MKKCKECKEYENAKNIKNEKMIRLQKNAYIAQTAKAERLH